MQNNSITFLNWIRNKAGYICTILIKLDIVYTVLRTYETSCPCVCDPKDPNAVEPVIAPIVNPDIVEPVFFKKIEGVNEQSVDLLILKKGAIGLVLQKLEQLALLTPEEQREFESSLARVILNQDESIHRRILLVKRHQYDKVIGDILILCPLNPLDNDNISQFLDVLLAVYITILDELDKPS